jgi:hypothetical protein
MKRKAAPDDQEVKPPRASEDLSEFTVPDAVFKKTRGKPYKEAAHILYSYAYDVHATSKGMWEWTTLERMHMGPGPWAVLEGGNGDHDETHDTTVLALVDVRSPRIEFVTMNVPSHCTHPPEEELYWKGQSLFLKVGPWSSVFVPSGLYAEVAVFLPRVLTECVMSYCPTFQTFVEDLESRFTISGEPLYRCGECTIREDDFSEGE